MPASRATAHSFLNAGWRAVEHLGLVGRAAQLRTSMLKSRSIMPDSVNKPWGYELIWAHTDRYVGKVLHVRAGHKLSLQFHQVKDETIHLWSGRMLLVIDEG